MRIILDLIFVMCGFILGVTFTNNAWHKRMVIISNECNKIQGILNDLIEKAKKEEERNDWK